MKELTLAVEKEVKERIQADCPSCKAIKVDFNYCGISTEIFTPEFISKIGTKTLLEKYGDVLPLYGCNSCSSSLSLKAIKDYNN